MALSYNDLDVAVRKKYLPDLQEQIFISNAFLARLLAKSKIVFDSGLKIVQPVIYKMLPGGSYWGMDTFDISYSQTQTQAEWLWKALYCNVTIPGTDLAIAEGDEKIMGLLESKMETAQMTMDELLSTMLFGDGTGNSNKDFDGLANAVDDGTNYPSYGNLNRVSDATWWIAQYSATGGPVTVDLINQMLGLTTIGTRKVDLMMTSQQIYDKVWARVQPAQRFFAEKGPNADIASVGFSGIEFNGHCAMVVDNHCPPGTIYFLNTDYWKLIINKNKNFTWTSEKTPTDQDAYVRQLLTMGNLICTQPRLQGALINLA